MEKVYIGKLGRAIGLKGYLKLYIDSDFPEQFKAGATFTTDRNSELTIEDLNSKNQSVKFIGIDCIEDAKRLTNRLLYTTIEHTKKSCKLEENQYFWFDIIGCDVYENDIKLGIVRDIQRFADTDYLQIDTHITLVEKNLPKTFLIPYIDKYISSVDIETKTIKTIESYAILENS